jgi:hypothetical protein
VTCEVEIDPGLDRGLSGELPLWKLKKIRASAQRPVQHSSVFNRNSAVRGSLGFNSKLSFRRNNDGSTHDFADATHSAFRKIVALSINRSEELIAWPTKRSEAYATRHGREKRLIKKFIYPRKGALGS